MNTPIADYVKQYTQKNSIRFHMPGHKGESVLGFEGLDITEINGADVLYSPNGIIKESEDNVSSLFSTAHTFYSAEGTSLTIKAMLYLVKSYFGNELRLLAGRNAHKTFLYGCGLLDIEPIWMYGEDGKSLCECRLEPETVENYIKQEKANAVYITSPDYLGNIADVEGISKVCKKYGALLLVDNAHGAYLKFLKKDTHPITLGADISCDSAHKTLPVITGGGYMHISKDADSFFMENAREALSLFASTSPSYLILQSLDLCNRYLEDDFKTDLNLTVERVNAFKERLRDLGYKLLDGEKLKIVIDSKNYGYLGTELADVFSKNGVECEFSDKDFLVFMVSPKNKASDFEKTLKIAEEIKKKKPIVQEDVNLPKPQKAMGIREALFYKKELVDVEASVGKICASPTVSCPPAIPIVISGEVITEKAVKIFKNYNINKVEIVKTDF